MYPISSPSERDVIEAGLVLLYGDENRADDPRLLIGEVCRGTGKWCIITNVIYLKVKYVAILCTEVDDPRTDWFRERGMEVVRIDPAWPYDGVTIFAVEAGWRPIIAIRSSKL